MLLYLRLSLVSTAVLTNLDLSHNNIGYEGAKAIANSLLKTPFKAAS